MIDVVPGAAATGNGMTLRARLESSRDITSRHPLSEAFLRAMSSHPETMVRLIIELHREVHDDSSLLELFNRTARIAEDCVPGVEWCSVTVQFDKAPFTAAHTDGWALAVDDEQYALDDGPCLRAMRSEQLVLMDQEELVATWPALAGSVCAAGVHSMLAAPLAGQRRAAGAINLYSSEAAAFTVDSLDVITVLGEYVARGIAEYAALRTAEAQTLELKVAMARRAPIEQAKGILMAMHEVSAEEAFDMLRTQSQHRNIKLHDVATAFVAAQSAHSLGNLGASGADDS